MSKPELFEYPTDLFDHLKPQDIHGSNFDEIRDQLKNDFLVDLVGIGSNMLVLKLDQRYCVAFAYGGSYTERPLKATLDVLHQKAFHLLYPTQFPSFYEASPFFEKNGIKYPGYTVRDLVEIDRESTDKLYEKYGYQNFDLGDWGLFLPPEYRAFQNAWLEAGIPLSQEEDRIGNFAINKEGHFVYLDVLTEELLMNPMHYFRDLRASSGSEEKYARPFWQRSRIELFLKDNGFNDQISDQFLDLATQAGNLRLLELSLEMIDKRFGRISYGMSPEEVNYFMQARNLRIFEMTRKGVSNRKSLREIQQAFDITCLRLEQSPFLLSPEDLEKYHQALLPSKL